MGIINYIFNIGRREFLDGLFGIQQNAMKSIETCTNYIARSKSSFLFDGDAKSKRNIKYRFQ